MKGRRENGEEKEENDEENEKIEERKEEKKKIGREKVFQLLTLSCQTGIVRVIHLL